MPDVFEFETKISGTLDGKKRVITVGEKLVAPKVNLFPGTTAPELKQLERCLVRLGYMKASEINGLWDFSTEQAIRALQTAWNLTADAKYGPKSQEALQKELDGQKPPNKNGQSQPQHQGGENQEELPPPLDYKGGDDAYGYKDVPGKVYWVHGLPANPNYWKNIKEADLHHWVSATDKYLHCADLPAGEIYGPTTSFKVTFVGTGKQCGGLVKLLLSNGAVIDLLHFSTFNIALKHAQQSGAPLPPGTHIGSTAKKIGLTSGPHLHAQGFLKGARIDRKQWLKWMHGLDGVTGFPMADVPNDAPDDVGFVTKPEEIEDQSGETETFAGTIKGPAGPLKNWPFKLKKDGTPIDPSGLGGGTTTTAFKGGTWLSGPNGEFKFERLPKADYEIEVLLPVGKLVAAETTLPPGLDNGHRSATPEPMAIRNTNEAPEEV